MNRRTTATATAGLAVAALLALSGCGDDAPTAAPQATVPAPAATTASTTTPVEPVAAKPSKPTFPTSVTAVQQGSTYYSVILTLVRGSSTGPANERAVAQAAAVGIEAFSGELSCLHGAAEAIKVDPDAPYTSTSVEFATAAQAAQFVAAYEPGVVGTAKVRTFCVDG